MSARASGSMPAGLSESHVRQLLRLKGVFLDGAEVTYQDTAPGETCGPEQAHLLVMAERPTDWGLYALDLEEEEKKSVLHSALQRYFDSVAEEGRAIAAWERAAWFFGAVAHCKGMSVSAFSEAIGHFEQRTRSHYATVAQCAPIEAFSEAPRPKYKFEEQPSPAREERPPVSKLSREEVAIVLRRIHYWGAVGDLHHAGLLGALRATERMLPAGKPGNTLNEGEPNLSGSEIEANQEILRETITERSQSKLPTMMMHPESPAHEKRKELQARRDELRS